LRFYRARDEELLTTSDQFLELEQLMQKDCFRRRGYISLSLPMLLFGLGLKPRFFMRAIAPWEHFDP